MRKLWRVFACCVVLLDQCSVFADDAKSAAPVTAQSDSPSPLKGESPTSEGPTSGFVQPVPLNKVDNRPVLYQWEGDMAAASGAWQQGQYEKAESMYRAAFVRAHTKKLGLDEEAHSLESLARLLAYLYRYEEALPVAQQALNASQEMNGVDGEDTFQALATLANVTDALGRSGEAEKLYRSAIKIRQNSNDVTSEKLPSLRVRLAANLVRQRKLSEALVEVRRAIGELKFCGRAGGVAPALRVLADLRRVEDNNMEAYVLAKAALSEESRAGTTSLSVDMLPYLDTLARCAEAADELDDACAAYRKAIGICGTLASLAPIAKEMQPRLDECVLVRKRELELKQADPKQKSRYR